MKYKIIEIKTKIKEYEVEARSEAEAKFEVEYGFHQPNKVDKLESVEVLNEEVSDNLC